MLLALVTLLVVGLWLPGVSELLAWLRRSPRTLVPETRSLPRLLILVPAHDEAGLVEACVRSLVAMEYPTSHRRIIVVADNCSDATAELARRAGAEALERHDRAEPGKPKALAWALRQCSPDDWDACVIVDADSVVTPWFARALATRGPLQGIALQAYFGSLNEWDSWLTRLAGVLTRSRYEFTYPLKQAAGLNCPLTGNGMCLGRELLREGWQAFSLTENWELYARYTARGIRIGFAGDAILHSQEASSMGQGGTQRRRWLAGRLGVLRQWGGVLLRSTAITPHQKLDALVELGAPSPVLHLVLAAAAAAVSLVLLPDPRAPWLAGFALASLAPLAFSTAAVLIRHPQPAATLLAFGMLPVYAVWRTLTALATLVSLKGMVWKKTSR